MNRDPSKTPTQAELPGMVTAAEAKSEAGDRSAWWVRTSAGQGIDSFGQPAGFRHALKWRNMVVREGKGADAGRTLRAQAEFLNRHAPGGPGPGLQCPNGAAT